MCLCVSACVCGSFRADVCVCVGRCVHVYLGVWLYPWHRPVDIRRYPWYMTRDITTVITWVIYDGHLRISRVNSLKTQ